MNGVCKRERLLYSQRGGAMEGGGGETGSRYDSPPHEMPKDDFFVYR